MWLLDVNVPRKLAEVLGAAGVKAHTYGEVPAGMGTEPDPAHPGSCGALAGPVSPGVEVESEAGLKPSAG
jgi:hypothetical protein